MASQDELIVRIGADLTELRQEMKKAGENVDKFGEKAKETSEGVSKGFSKMKIGVLAVVAALGAAAIAMKKFSDSVATNAREQRLWAKRLNVNVEVFSQLVAVGQTFGATVDDMGDSIKDLNERIADAARGNKTYGDALKVIGLNAKDLIKIPIEDQFLKVADAIGKLNNAGDQNFITAELMADAGFRLLPAFRAGEEGIRAMMKATEELGASFNEEEVELYQNFDKALISLKQAAFAVAKPLANELTSALTGAAEATATVLRDTVAYRNELRELRLELEATAKSGNVISSEVGEISTGLDMAAGSFDQLAESMKSYKEVSEEVSRTLESQVGREGIQIPVIGGGGLETEGNINEMFEEALAGPSLNELFEEQLNLAEQHQMSLLDIHKRGSDARVEVDKKEKMSRTQAMQGIFSSLSNLMNTENRKLFEIGKAAAIADATVNTYLGANKALGAAPPPYNFALAGAVVASGLANVASIASTSMGGGGGAGGGATSAPGGGDGATLVQENVIDASFNIEGTNVSTDQIRGVFGELQEYIDDGAKLRTVSVM